MCQYVKVVRRLEVGVATKSEIDWLFGELQRLQQMDEALRQKVIDRSSSFSYRIQVNNIPDAEVSASYLLDCFDISTVYNLQQEAVRAPHRIFKLDFSKQGSVTVTYNKNKGTA